MEGLTREGFLDFLIWEAFSGPDKNLVPGNPVDGPDKNPVSGDPVDGRMKSLSDFSEAF